MLVLAIPAAIASAALPRLVAAQTAPTETPAPTPQELPTVNIIGSSPLLGSGVDRNTVPAETSVLTGKDVSNDGTANALRTLDERVPGLTLDNAAGNPLQPNLLYHGFEASPLQGNEQGLAVYLDGVRFNQAFGDTVNWDLVPDIAIDRLNVEGANPVFGLNALGGSVNVQLKNGFTYHGGELVLSGGSFGQIQGQFQYGLQSGNEALYVAGSGLHEDGWRDLQSTDAYNFHSDMGWRSDQAELHFEITAANSVLNGPGTSPVELLAVDPRSQFTAPNLIANKFLQVNLNGSYDVTDNTSLQGQAYYSYFLQRVVNGNAANDAPCDDGSGLLCSDPGVYSTTRGGLPIADFLNGGPYSELDDQTTNTNAYGASLQATNTSTLYGFKNHLVAGLSFDGAQTEFSASGAIGGLTPLDRVFVGPGVTIDEPGNNTPVRVAISDAYYGAFLTDTLDVTDRLSATLAGRFNSAQIGLTDQGGGDLTGQHAYNRFNPAAGLTYRLTNWLTAYAGYSEANRAPTPAELSCAGPDDSCSLANFFVGDPDLKQVVSHTVEAGLRGETRTANGLKIGYNAGLFRSDLDDDIIFVNSVTLGRAFFENVGQTRRQGVDAGLSVAAQRWSAFVNYSYTDATFQTGYVEAAGSNPQADANGNITVNSGARLPGVPAHLIKFGADYRVTDQWTVGATGRYTSGTYLFGDEANLNPKLPGYFVLNFHTSYQVTPNVQLFGLVENLTDTKYYTYGTFSPTTSVYLAQAPNATNPRSYSPAAPIGGFGGVRVTF